MKHFYPSQSSFGPHCSYRFFFVTPFISVLWLENRLFPHTKPIFNLFHFSYLVLWPLLFHSSCLHDLFYSTNRFFMTAFSSDVQLYCSFYVTNPCLWRISPLNIFWIFVSLIPLYDSFNPTHPSFWPLLSHSFCFIKCTPIILIQLCDPSHPSLRPISSHLSFIINLFILLIHFNPPLNPSFQPICI